MSPARRFPGTPTPTPRRFWCASRAQGEQQPFPLTPPSVPTPGLLPLHRTILTDGDSYDFAPGVPFHVKRTVQHRIVNDSASEKLWLTWTLSPPQSVATFTKQARGHGAQALSTDTDEGGGGSEALSPTAALAQLGVDDSTLSDAEKKQLDEQGFLPVEGVVGEAHLKAMKEACEEMLAYNAVDGQEYSDSYDEHEGKALTVANLQNKSTLFDLCFTHPKVVAAISYVLGREVEGAEWEGMRSAGIHTRANEPGWGANNFGTQQSLHTDGSTEAEHPHYVVCNSMWMLDDFTCVFLPLCPSAPLPLFCLRAWGGGVADTSRRAGSRTERRE